MPIGRPGEHPDFSVAIDTEAYEAIMEASSANTPAETVGVLVGVRYRHARRTLVRISDVRSLGLLPEQRAPKISKEQRTGLAPGALETVGWFYADPGIGIFPPRSGLKDLRLMIAPGTELFLLVNPATGQVAFYRWLDEGLRQLEGFYEALPPALESSITSEGVVPSAAAWLAAAGMSIIVDQPSVPDARDQESGAVALPTTRATSAVGTGDMP
ncbi:MAG: hypothetical protein M3328_10535, partial [Chloroflexota bacterium]|nr:hypothetical protein [Chloroflexota bacterium]